MVKPARIEMNRRVDLNTPLPSVSGVGLHIDYHEGK